MKLKILLLLLISLIALPVIADVEEARIVTSINRPLDCLFSVTVYNINGKSVITTPLAFNIKPGKYTFKLQARLNKKKCNPTITSARINRIAPLEIEVEAGKSYFLVYNASAPSYRDWKVEILKVE